MKNILFIDGKIPFFSQCAHTCAENGYTVFFLVSTHQRKKTLEKNGHPSGSIYLLPEQLSKSPSENTLGISQAEIDKAMKFMRQYSDLPESFYDTRFYSYMYRTINCAAAVIEQMNIGLCVMFNYLLYPLPLVRLCCKKKETDMLFFENGLFRPDTLSVDTKGLNFENSVPRSPAFYTNEYSPEHAESAPEPDITATDHRFTPLNPVSVLLLKLRFRIRSLLKYEYRLCRFTRSTGRTLIRPVRKKLITLFKKPDQPDLDYPFYFIPFQVERDSQILKFSPYIRTMRELVSTLTETLARMKQHNSFTDIHLVFKEHPEDHGYVNHADIYRSSKNIPWIHFLRSYSTETLIRKSAGIITVNSTVAIEALDLNKKVLTLGKAFFNIEGMVKHADSKEALEKVLKEFRGFTPDRKLTERFLHFLRHSYNIPGTWHNPSGEDVTYASARIMKEARRE